MLALDQDALGKPALRVGAVRAVDVFAKDLKDHSKALGFFNRSRQTEAVTYNKLGRIGLSGKQHVRDLWRQKNLDDANGSLELSVPGHGGRPLETRTCPVSEVDRSSVDTHAPSWVR